MPSQIRKRGRSWQVRVLVGHTRNGKPKYHSRTFRYKKDADAYLTKTVRERQTGTFVAPARESLDEYLAGYLESARVRVRPRTWRSYDDLLRLYVRPALGTVPLSQLSPELIQRTYNDLLARGLAPRTVRYAHAVLSAALRQAVRRGKLARNPAELVDLPRAENREMQALSAEQAGRFLDAARGDPWYPFFLLALTSGMRPAELLGLRWQDVNLEAATVSVQRVLVRTGGAGPWELAEPKTARSRRVIKLPASVTCTLRAHRTAQDETRRTAGPEWRDHGLVFTGPYGAPPQYRNLIRRHFKPILAEAGLPQTLRLYDLRHSCATLLLEAGENPKVVAERLGHTSVALLLDVYSHVLPDMQQRAAERLDALLFGRQPE